MTTVSNNSGFTLIELMVVIIISAVLASIGVSAYGRIQETANLERKTFETVAALQLARAESAVRGVPVGCTFAPNGVYCFTRTDNQITGPTVVTDTDGDGLLEAGGDVSAIISQVRFNDTVSIIAAAPTDGIQGTGVGADSYFFLNDGSVIGADNEPASFTLTLIQGNDADNLILDSYIRIRSTGSVAKVL